MQLDCTVILFDLDGVLIDSTACIVRHWQQWAERHDLDLSKIMSIAHGRRTVETIRLVAPHLAAEEEAQQFAEIEASDTQGVVTIPGAIALIGPLPANAWAIVTSGTREVATNRLKSQGLPVPKTMVTAEDVINGKPNPEPYLAAANILGISAAHCVVVEDSPAGITAANAAGMRSIAVAFTHAYQELTAATAIASQLKDIQVTGSPNGHLAIHITP